MADQAVIGVGNQIMRDDGLSAAVIDALSESDVAGHPEVTLSHVGTTAFFALEAMDGADRAIVVDAIQAPDADPGDIHRIAYRDGAFESADFDINMHDFSFTEALAAGDHAYAVPEEIVVLGMTPKAVTAGLELSETVREKLDELVTLVREELERGGTRIDEETVLAEGST